MGTWGTSLYSNDSASDIRGDYLDKLRRGKSNEDVTQELIDENQDIMGDVDDEPLFWFALADTQWNYGRLLPEVKEKALYFLAQNTELERWQDAGQKKVDAWIKTLSKLKDKLEAPQPAEKKVSKYRLYQCKWNLGDVFAYRFSSEYSKEKGFYGQYVVFRKISENIFWPGHIVPVIQVYKWIGQDVPTLEKLADLELLPAFYKPSAYIKFPDKKVDYEIEVLSESERVIPKENLHYIGNLPGNDLIPFCGSDKWVSHFGVGWKLSKCGLEFEHYIIDQYLAWTEEYSFD